MAQLRKQLGSDGGKFRIVFVSVDPGYASPEDVGRYVALFGAPILGLTGTDVEVDSAVKAYRAFYQKVPTNFTRRCPPRAATTPLTTPPACT